VLQAIELRHRAEAPPPARPKTEPPNAPPQAANPCTQWPDAIVFEMAPLVLKVQHDAEKIVKKAGHLAESRRYPQDCLRNAEILEGCAMQLQTHARQIIRRALENQP